MSLTEQGETVGGEAPAALLDWLAAIDDAYAQVADELRRRSDG